MHCSIINHAALPKNRTSLQMLSTVKHASFFRQKFNEKKSFSMLTKSDVRVVDHAWRGAEAFHFLMLCQVVLKLF
jgi:hypothetical protein